MTDDTEPSAEAKAVIKELFDNWGGLTGAPDEIVFQTSIIEQETALALDRFRAAGVREWRPIETFEGEGPFCKVDIWMNVHASPRSMGWADAFRVSECWRQDSKWFHYHGSKAEELAADYITHWMLLPEPPHDL